jgi:hypothetical protein
MVAPPTKAPNSCGSIEANASNPTAEIAYHATRATHSAGGSGS